MAFSNAIFLLVDLAVSVLLAFTLLTFHSSSSVYVTTFPIVSGFCPLSTSIWLWHNDYGSDLKVKTPAACLLSKPTTGTTVSNIILELVVAARSLPSALPTVLASAARIPKSQGPNSRRTGGSVEGALEMPPPRMITNNESTISKYFYMTRWLQCHKSFKVAGISLVQACRPEVARVEVPNATSCGKREIRTAVSVYAKEERIETSKRYFTPDSKVFKFGCLSDNLKFEHNVFSTPSSSHSNSRQTINRPVFRTCVWDPINQLPPPVYAFHDPASLFALVVQHVEFKSTVQVHLHAWR